MRASLASIIVAGLFTHTGAAAPILIPVDQAQSQLSIELCFSGNCDDDASAVSGSIEIELDSLDAPTTITLHNLDLALVDDLDLNISLGIFGGLTATATGVTVDYATPGFPNGPAAIVSDAFTLPNVEVIPGGDVNYNATGLVCSALTGSGLPCSGTFDLSQNGPSIVDQAPGQVTSVNRLVTVSVDLEFSAPIDPANPGLGNYTVSGTVVGSLLVPPCDGDANGDDVVNFDDLNLVLENWSASVAPGTLGDVTNDGTVNFDDLNRILERWGEEC